MHATARIRLRGARGEFILPNEPDGILPFGRSRIRSKSVAPTSPPTTRTLLRSASGWWAGARRAMDRPNPPSRYAGSPAVFFPNVGFQIGVATQASLHVGVDDSRMDSQHAHMRRSELELAGLNQGEPAERRLGDAVQSHTGERQRQFRTSERRCDENNAGFPRREPVMLKNRRRDPQPTSSGTVPPRCPGG